VRRALALCISVLAVVSMTALARAADPVRLTVGANWSGDVDDSAGITAGIDPRRDDDEIAREVFRLQYPTLVALDAATLDPTPGLAREWTPTADGRGWQYTLGEHTWSDGRPVTSDDVVYSLEHARDEHWPYAGATLDDLEIRKLDDRRVEVRSGRLDTTLPTLLLHIVPAHVFGDPTMTDPAGTGVSAGRWRAVAVEGPEVRMQAVDGPARPPIDEIVYRWYGDGADLADAIVAGKIDAASGFGAGRIDELHAGDGVTVTHANDGAQVVVIANVEGGSGALRDAGRRRIVADAIDRDHLVATVVHGVGRAQELPVAARGASWQLPNDAAAPDTTASEPATADIAVTIGSVGADQISSETANELARQLADAGFGTRLVDDPDAADLVVVHHGATDDPRPALSELTCAAGYWCDASYDELFRQFDAADVTTRSELARRMLERAVDQNVELALFAPDVAQAFRSDNVSGWLREAEEERLVVFAPSIEQYHELTPATAPPGEEPGNGVLVAGALALAAGFAAVAVVTTRIRRRHIASHDAVATT
jgi:ABC-type transport system substrate-binding protein